MFPVQLSADTTRIRKEKKSTLPDYRVFVLGDVKFPLRQGKGSCLQNKLAES